MTESEEMELSLKLESVDLPDSMYIATVNGTRCYRVFDDKGKQPPQTLVCLMRPLIASNGVRYAFAHALPVEALTVEQALTSTKKAAELLQEIPILPEELQIQLRPMSNDSRDFEAAIRNDKIVTPWIEQHSASMQSAPLYV